MTGENGARAGGGGGGDNEPPEFGSSSGVSSATPISEMSIIFLSFIEMVPDSPTADMKLFDSSLDEYVSRHTLDGGLIYVDPRITSILGFMPDEVMGKSAYEFILAQDYTVAIFAQRMSKSSRLLLSKVNCVNLFFLVSPLCSVEQLEWHGRGGASAALDR